MTMLSQLSGDPAVAEIVAAEQQRQCGCIELIASENFTSPAVMAAVGSVLTNKYAEGYPGKRYYNGCEHVDAVERLGIARAKQLFGAEHANLQPHSGAQANMAAYYALLSAGDTVLGMSLAEGGHLTHGSPVNFSGSTYNFVPYGVDPASHRLDYDVLEALAQKHRPKLIIGGATAYPRAIDFAALAGIAKRCGALLMVDMAHIAGLVAAGVHESPVPHADVVTSTTHKTLRGPRGGFILCKKEYAARIDKGVFPGTQGGPLMHVIAGKAVAFGEALQPAFAQYAKEIVTNAQALARALLSEGFDLVSGGTDNHLLLVDLRPFGITGRDYANDLDKVGITVNKNNIPGDPQPPNITSGIRVGTPAITTRGFTAQDMPEIARLMKLVATDAAGTRDRVLDGVRALCEKHPLYA